jgi:hypothetical protein
MAIGTVFIYLLIAALLFPLVWAMWWAASSVGSARPETAGVPRVVAAGGRPRLPFPTVIDIALPTRRNAVTIYSLQGREIATCAGPDAAGKCPRPLEDGSVPCSGCLLALPRRIRGSFEWQIPSGYRSCLLGSYATFRQAGQAG